MGLSITVANPGLLTTVQDLGRVGYQKFGMPQAGAMDHYALQVANILVGNNRKEAVLEITFPGLVLEFAGTGVIAITGADLGATLNGSEIEPWQSLEVNNSDILKFTSLKKGCRAYLAVQGGIDVPVIMGSKSTYLRGKIGGYEGRKLMAGDTLIAGNGCINYTNISLVPRDLIPNYDRRIVRVVLGPQDSYFSQKEITKFLTSQYAITNQYDRMGYRLEGPVIKHRKQADIISDGIAPGAIQIPGHGQPIIMLADRQTTGGYAKIATVISVDLSLLAQLMPGNRISFQEVSLKEAQELFHVQESKLIKLMEQSK